MAWITPKTDWYGYIDNNGNYAGDRFNAHDYNRIKNNLSHLRNMAIILFDEFDIVGMGADRTPVNYVYADEINLLETNFNTINANSLIQDYGPNPTYVDNGPTMDYNELNRLEGAMLDIYSKLHSAIEGRRTFTWNFGMKGGDL